MPEYQAPGVYVEEIPQRPKPIEGVATSTAAFLGETERGPTWPRRVTSFSEYTRYFGGTARGGIEPGGTEPAGTTPGGGTHPPDKFMPYAVNGFFENGGRRLYVCRVTGAEARHASRTFGAATIYAIGAGEWGNRVYARIDPASPAAGDAPAAPPSASNTFRLRVAYWATPPAGFQPYDVFDAPAGTGTGTTPPAPTAVESHNDLSIDPDSPDYFEKRLTPGSSTGSALVYLDFGGETPIALPAFEGGALTGGTDGQAVSASDFIGKAGVGGRVSAQGLEALDAKEFAEVALIHAPYPGAATAAGTSPGAPTAHSPIDAIHRAIVTHCESNRFRFAVLDCNRGTSPITSLDPRATLDTKFAAFYCPWLHVADPSSGARTLVPPGGYVAGVYVRTDMERGVHAAPANQVVIGALDVEVPVREAEQEVLNPRGVNVIRQFTGRGIRVWGARTLSSDPEWKYVNVRRLFMFLERSIEQGLQWVVFEPNHDEALWARVRESVWPFLRAQWKSGALQGRTEQEAFFVKCDRTTMTQEDIQTGRLIVLVGVAAVKPAEFALIRISP